MGTVRTRSPGRSLAAASNCSPGPRPAKQGIKPGYGPPTPSPTQTLDLSQGRGGTWPSTEQGPKQVAPILTRVDPGQTINGHLACSTEQGRWGERRASWERPVWHRGNTHLTSLPLVSGNTYLTSYQLVSVRRHGHANSVNVEKNTYQYRA